MLSNLSLNRIDGQTLIVSIALTQLVIPFIKYTSRYLIHRLTGTTTVNTPLQLLIRWLTEQMTKEKERRDTERMPKRIILVRHGQSLGNVDPSTYNVTPDAKITLSEMGKSQAMDAGKKIKEMIQGESVVFYVSPFLRCKETLDQILLSFNNRNQYRIREDPRIREQEWGNLQKPEDKDKVVKERDLMGRFFYRFPQGESGADVFDRVSMFLASLFRHIKEGEPYDNIVIVTHGLLMRLFLMRYYYWSVNKFESLDNFRNCEVIVMTRKGYEFNIDEAQLRFRRHLDHC